ncbi:hypothetical protein ABT126_25820 [Streptomyces sp. NPDC002012]|uniref:hypothetical protein n=1 Tax=Streptomyces sp. NPDC002012 TaxID=3154532 RepID=UPI00332DF1D6
MAVVVGVLITRDARRQVLSLEDLSNKVGIRRVYTAIEHGNDDTLARARLPHFVGLHGIEMPLLGTDGVGRRGYGNAAHQQ